MTCAGRSRLICRSSEPSSRSRKRFSITSKAAGATRRPFCLRSPLDARCAHEFPSLAITREAEAREADQHHRPGRRLRYRAAARGREATAGADAVVVQRYSSVQGYGSAAGDVCAGVERNARQCVDRADEISGGPKGGGTADLPKDVGAAGAVDKINVGSAGGRQRAANLEEEDSVRIAFSGERQFSSELRRRHEKVDAGREGKAAQILSGQVISGRQPGGDSVRVRCVGLGRPGDGGVVVDSSGTSRWKARDRGSGGDPQ